MFIISGIAVICVALLFAERYVLRRASDGSDAPWSQHLANLLRGMGFWWLILGASGLLIPLFFTIILGYSSEDTNGDLSILMGHILDVAAGLALVTLGLTLVLLLTGVGMLFYLKSRRSRYVQG